MVGSSLAALARRPYSSSDGDRRLLRDPRASSARATDADIKRAFRKLAQQWHPDVNTDPDADAQFKEINEAYQVLSDPQRRQALRHVRDGGVGGDGAEGRRSAASAASATSSTRSSAAPRQAGAARPAAGRRGPALRPADHASRRRSTGAEKEIEFPVLGPLRDVRRQRRRSRARSRSPARSATAAARSATCATTMLGQMVNVTHLPALPRRRPDRRDAVRHVPRRGPDRAQADAPGDDPGRHRRGPPDPAVERGRGRAARRRPPAPCTSPSTSTPHPTLKREGTELVYERRRLDRPGRARARGSSSRPSTARRWSRSSPAPSPAPRSGSAARACRTCAGRAARRPPRARRRRRPDALSTRAARAARGVAAEAGELVPADGTAGIARASCATRGERGLDAIAQGRDQR